jgi:hypothetical protein
MPARPFFITTHFGACGPGGVANSRISLIKMNHCKGKQNFGRVFSAGHGDRRGLQRLQLSKGNRRDCAQITGNFIGVGFFLLPGNTAVNEKWMNFDRKAFAEGYFWTRITRWAFCAEFFLELSFRLDRLSRLRETYTALQASARAAPQLVAAPTGGF